VYNFIAQNLDHFGDLLDKTVIDAGVGNMALKKFHKTQTVIEAIRMMVQQKVSAIPIVDDYNRIVGVISVRDIRLLVNKRSNVSLKLPLSKFLEYVRHGESVHTDVVVGSISDKVRDIIMKIHDNHIQRVFIVDPDNSRVTGVVTMGDIFKFLLYNDEDYKNYKKDQLRVRLEETARKREAMKNAVEKNEAIRRALEAKKFAEEEAARKNEEAMKVHEQGTEAPRKAMKEERKKDPQKIEFHLRRSDSPLFMKEGRRGIPLGDPKSFAQREVVVLKEKPKHFMKEGKKEVDAKKRVDAEELELRREKKKLQQYVLEALDDSDDSE
jgi:CBS domain-containing protein